MGRSSRKIKRKVKNNINEAGTNKKASLNLPQEFFDDLGVINIKKDDGEYDEALELVIKSFETYGVQVQSAYEAADIYYLSGDYERTALWCDNTLRIDDKNVKALLLLGKLALIKDETENVLALLTKIVTILHFDIDAYRQDIEDLFRLILIDYEADAVKEKYPLLWKCLYDDTNMACAEEPIIQEKVPEAVIPDDVHAEEKNIVAETSSIQVNPIEDVQAEIMAMSISLKEKVAVCHTKAAEYYEQNDLNAALMMLRLALAIDNTDDLTLKNTGFILLKIGETAEAKECFKRIQSTDLMLLELIK